MINRIDLSIVICTFNRIKSLQKALNSLLNSNVGEHFVYEILIVDNNSNDNTREIIKEEEKRNSSIHYLFVKTQGLSYARNFGFTKAKGEYIAYIDDDCIVPTDWIREVQNIICENNPDIFGGPYIPYYITKKPKWYKDDYGSFMQGKFPSSKGGVKDFYLCGGNLIIKRKLLITAGGFNVDLGMSGNHIAYAEEGELQKRILQEFPNTKIYFDPELIVLHLVPPHKMRIYWRIRQQFSRGKSLVILNNEKQENMNYLQYWSKLTQKILFVILHFVKGVFFRDYIKFRTINNWIYEQTALYIAHIGALRYRYQNRIRKDDID
jgi:glucosyl-dolichyl phosphate glucuronosyltransferase